ncbi:MAG: nucleotidyltransferase family protein [Clostridia bacterium]|nr:nucleotidyltransferase family protein [Clostridia bacterium]
MRTVGIISEYNPFHNGHKRQLDLIRSRLDCRIVSIMSPNIVQRGELSLFDKYERARASVLSGVDLCVSMPAVFANLSAEGFAEAGVKIAHSLGADTLSFGVECDSVELLSEIAELSLTEAFSESVSALCRDNPSLSLIKAGELVLTDTLGDGVAKAVSQPNNILALEYIKAIKRLGLPIELLPVKREGEGYKSLVPSALPSATLVRRELIENGRCDGLVPDEARDIYHSLLNEGRYTDLDLYSRIVKATLTPMPLDELEIYLGSRELASRLLTGLGTTATLSEAIDYAVCARYTRARIKRGTVSALFKIKHNEFMHATPEFAQLLAFSSKGRELLSELRGDFKIVTKPADMPDCRQARLERLIDGTWAGASAKALPYNYFIKKSPFVKGQ